jgi:RHS repeat-associated protein
VNGSGTVVVEYAYDAWGKPMGVTGSMAGTLGAANPFRYRGYYYDSETGLYYLNSRYYNPEWGRLLCVDSI